MNTVITVLCSILVVLSVVLVVAVLVQTGKGKKLSGTIVGGGETFYGKQKGKSKDRMLSVLTIVVSVIFAVIVLAVYILQVLNK